MFFINCGKIKFGTFLNYDFQNMIDEIGMNIFQQNCGHSFDSLAWIDYEMNWHFMSR